MVTCITRHIYFLSAVKCGGFERGHLLFCLNVIIDAGGKGPVIMLHEVCMGAEEGPRAPN